MGKEKETTSNLKAGEEEQVVVPPQSSRLTSHANATSIDRLKRDEWSQGAVACLLDAYESKWVLRNRAKLKGHDWEDVACQVSSRGGGGSSNSKTATQCKNKIESMKKRYRNETASGSRSLSRWPLFSRIDGLVRWRSAVASTSEAVKAATSLMPVVCYSDAAGTRNGVELAADRKNQMEADQIQHAELHKEIHQNVASCSDSSKQNEESVERKNKEKKRKRSGKKEKEGEEEEEEGWEEVVESIRYLSEVVLRVEQARMEATRDVEKIRAQTEAKKGEMDLKRTEVIANTQLQIAKLYARIKQHK